jgi:hypothetical protein
MAIFKFNRLLLVASFGLFSCTDNGSIPADLTYNAEKTGQDAWKCILKVTLSRSLNEQELTGFGKRWRAWSKQNNCNGNLFVFYYLSSTIQAIKEKGCYTQSYQNSGNGLFATTHYTDETLEVSIVGPTEEEEQLIYSMARKVDGELIKSWFIHGGTVSWTVSLYKKDNEFFTKHIWYFSSKNLQPENKGTIYPVQVEKTEQGVKLTDSNSHNESYLIAKNGCLELYNGGSMTSFIGIPIKNNEIAK